jgi:hypothetical protein
MTIPTSAKNQSDTGAPQGKRQPTAAKFVTWQQCGTRRPFAESKKDKHLLTFWALWPFREMFRPSVAFRQQFLGDSTLGKATL